MTYTIHKHALQLERSTHPIMYRTSQSILCSGRHPPRLRDATYDGPLSSQGHGVQRLVY
jgi:hypothetical protein